MRYVFLLRLLAVFLPGLLGALHPAQAQKGRYEVRLVPAGADCGTKKGLVRLQLRAPKVDSSFRLGNASFRFDYDPRQVKNLVLKTEEAFSNSAPANDGNYAPQTLSAQEGSTLATASLSVFYTGSNKGATLVGTTWVSVATLEYDVVSTTGCIGFTWHTDTQFPVTGMSEVVITSTSPFVYSQQEVVSAKVFQHVKECVLPVATAQLTGDTTILAGSKARLKVAFSGQGPWSFKLSDGTTVTATTDNPRLVEVSPTQTATFSLASVSGACGPGSVSGQAVVTVSAKPAPTLTLTNFSLAEVCPGQDLNVAFTTTGEFNPGNTFAVQLSDSTGTKFTTLTSGNASPLAVTIPASTPAHSGYRLRVVASDPITASALSAAFRVKLLPKATLSGSQTIQEGQSANLTVAFTGDGPWTFQLTDGTPLQAPASPHTVKVTPIENTTYTLASVSNGCGAGTVSGSATVTVTPKPAPTLALQNFTTTEICAGQKLSIAFTTTGEFKPSNTFAVQLSDSTGTKFTTLTSGNASPLAVTIPASTPAHGGYRLRVVGSSPASTSPLSPAFRVQSLPTATLAGEQTIQEGQSANLSVALTGKAPWSFRLSDSTLVETTSQNPHPVKVTPAKTTTYTVAWVSNACGKGTVSGRTVVNVVPKPDALVVTLDKLPAAAFCPGQSLPLGFTTGGLVAPGTRYKIQLSDLTGQNFTDLSADTTASPISVKLPATLASGFGYRLRVLATVPGAPSVSSSLSEALRILGKPTATLSGDTTVAPGQSAGLKITLAGDGPWSFALSDSTQVTGATQANHPLMVKPAKTTTYTLASVGNACGPGTATGQATVTVKVTDENPTTPIACVPVCVPYVVVKTKRKP